MNIAFYAPMKPPNHPTPSGDRHIAKLLLKALTFAGFDVHVASDLRSWEGGGDRQLQRHLKQRGQHAATHLIDHYQTLPPKKKPTCWFTYHLYHKAPDWLGPPVSEALGIPYIVAEASVAPKQAHGKWKEGYQCSIDALHRADLVFNLNPVDRAQIKKNITSKTKIIDLKPFLALPPQNTNRHLIRQQIAIEKKIHADHYWLLCVAMMRPGSKLESYRVLADTLDHMQRKDWELIVIGGGSMHGEIKQAFKPYQNVHLLGVQEKAYIYQCMYACNLFVWPAINEAFGMAVLEALACGLPVVAGNSGGIEQLVQHHQTGVLIERINGANLAQQIENLLDHPDRIDAMSRHSQARFHACHTLERGAHRLKKNILPLLKPTD